MRSFLYFLTALGVMALAVWAYQENHRTQQARAELRAMEREIDALRAALAMQRAEWAYLNRPERLRALVDMNFARLGLMPMTVDQYGLIGEIVYPDIPHGQTPAPLQGAEAADDAPDGDLGDIRHAAGTRPATSDPAEAP